MPTSTKKKLGGEEGNHLAPGCPTCSEMALVQEETLSTCPMWIRVKVGYTWDA